MARDLTPLEYIVLGLIGFAPQTGYSIISYFDEDSYNSWSASPGSVYPMLKRLEKQEIITGELEMEHETRPRKVYTLTDTGSKLLDEWLREVPKMRPFYQELELAQLRFQFMERRLPREAVLTWLRGYKDALHYASTVEQIYAEPIRRAMAEDSTFYSLHSELLMQVYMMELNILRTWVDTAIMRLEAD
jgi:DNA-binding PadR family transcriptional regulator